MSNNNGDIEQIIGEENNGKDSLKKLHDIVYALDEAAIVAITDRSGKITYVNELFTKISQYNSDELLGKSHRMINSGRHSAAFFKDMWGAINQGDMWRGEICNRRKDGSLYWVDTAIVPLLNEEGKVYQHIAIRSDITAKKHMEEEVRESAEMYRLITENTHDIVVVVDKEANIKYLSPSHKVLLGYSLSELAQSSLYSIALQEDHVNVKSKVLAAYEADSIMKPIEFRIRNADGKIVFIEATINRVSNSGKYYKDIVLVMRDITERKESERIIHDLAYNDQLTDLLNRSSFREKVFEEIENARNISGKIGFVYINIDRLRYVNDSLGHEAGDYVLTVVAKRLKEILRYDDTVARLDGDEFAFVLLDIDDAAHALKIAKEVQRFIEEPIEVADQVYVLSTSCGISLYPEHAQSPAELVMKAEKALQNVKARGGAGYELYKHGTAEKTLERILLENEMGKSVKSGNFYLDYQPKVNLLTGQWIGLEALVRWKHPDLGLIRPDKFILVAEETKLILPLGEWILREACEQIKKWEEKGSSLRVAVNISAVQLEDPTFLGTVQAILSETGVSPKYIEFELTESAIGNQKELQGKLLEVRKLGIIISIDDFGTGYSTFSYIKDLPADILKIDMSFVRDIHVNKGNRAIVKAIISLAKTVGLRVIAEGIEHQGQRDVLLALGCEEGQGYFYSKPITPEECDIHMSKSIISE